MSSCRLVLKAKSRVTGDLYAVKIVDKEKHKALDVQMLFQTEIGVMSKLSEFFSCRDAART